MIGLAVYRPDPRLLEDQIRSISDQTLVNWRCNIAIDGDDPEALGTVTSLVNGDDRFVVHAFRENVGFYRNFERLIGLVSPEADWIALADQDDYWYPHKLERLVSELLIPGASAASGQARVVDKTGATISTTKRAWRSIGSLIYDNQVTGSMAVFRSGSLEAALPFPDPTDAAYHDHWLGAMASTYGEIRFVDDVLQDYVQHEANVLGEQHGRSMTRRVTTLLSAGRSPGGVISHVAHHRWGWRVQMARTLISRRGPGAVPAVVKSISAGSIRPRSAWSLVLGVLRGDVDRGRGIALLGGSAAWTIGIGRITEQRTKQTARGATT